MKKFAVILIILIILGGTSFFFGWVQLTIPPGSYGIMRSKTHGLDPQIIQEGAVRWVWYKLIPANVDIQVFTLDKVSRSLKTKDTLPSGSEYASFAGFSVDFSYEVSLTFSFTIKPNSLIPLINLQHITDQKDLDAFEEELAHRIEIFALQRLRIYMEDVKKIEEILQSGSIVQLTNDITEAFPDIENLSCFIHTANFPDLNLYRQLSSLYEEYIERQKAYVRTERILQPDYQLTSYHRLDTLAKYGELLTKYPILLQFLEIEKKFP